jgi:hypothetical protein
MKTICIETKISSSIGGGIRYSWDDLLYTTNRSFNDPVRDHNLRRLWKCAKTISQKDIYNILDEKNNIQIVSNDWSVDIPWFHKNPQNHPILSKTWIIELFIKNNLERYLPKSIIVKQNNIYDTIKLNFLSWEKVVIKHPAIDWNWTWVSILENNSSLKTNIVDTLNKFILYFKWDTSSVLWCNYLLQEYILDSLWEWSVTFSIQNDRIENRWIANNIVEWWGYFASTNIFSYMNKEDIDDILSKIEKDFQWLLTSMQKEGVRWNVWFDIIFQKKWESIKPYVLECNGLHRMTGSSMPNNFANNTKNNLFLWLPISKKYLSWKYQDLSNKSLIRLADKFQSLWNDDWKPQIINIKLDWIDRWYPVLWISVAGNYKEEMFHLLNNVHITNKYWDDYIDWIVRKIL